MSGGHDLKSPADHNQDLGAIMNARTPMSLLKLPNELLDFVCQNLCNEHPLPEFLSAQLKIRCTSSGINTLSLVNRQLRKTCLPFLFAHLRIRGIDDAQKFKKFCSENTVCFQFVRMLTLRNVDLQNAKVVDKIVCSLLPRFKSLACINLRQLDQYMNLLRLIPEHRTDLTVLADQLSTVPSRLRVTEPYTVSSPSFTGLNLSKILLLCLHLVLPRPQEDFALNGMKVIALDVLDSERLEADFASYFFDGLRELTLKLPLDTRPVSFSWLSEFTSGHQYLQEIRLVNPRLGSQVPPFISPFFDEAARLGLQQELRICEIYLSRVKTEAQPTTQQWNITQITLLPRDRFIEILSLIVSFFPTVERLSVDLFHDKSTCGIDDVVSVLSRYPSLQKLDLPFSFNNICDTQGKGRYYSLDDYKQRVDTIDKGLRLLASRLAKAITTLKAFHFEERGVGYLPSNSGIDRRVERRWNLKGELHVDDGSRDIIGELKFQLDDRSYVFKIADSF
ncbi:hypothetical protein GYMLUDRAFT_240292 [Collybiopsis luxurians FD-317 M1]|nr:hypothetical protein GYMLUDRAFT_240292 [Collybiopsis luxurians FD-317 M1]